MSLIYEKLHVLVNLWVINFTKFGRWNKSSSWSLIDTSKKYDFILDSLMSFSHYLLGHVCALLSIHVRQCTQKKCVFKWRFAKKCLKWNRLFSPGCTSIQCRAIRSRVIRSCNWLPEIPCVMQYKRKRRTLTLNDHDK